MYVVVIGGGRVGFYLAKALLEEGHEVLIVEKNAGFCEVINDELGSICYRGDGCETSTLSQVGTGRANLFIAVTGDDEDNLVACQVAKHTFNVPRTIARIRNPRNEVLFKKLGIDVTISSTNVILEQIAGEVPTHPLIHLHDIRDKGLEIVEIRVPADATVVGKALRDIDLPVGTIVPLVVRKALRPIVPTPSTILMADDQVIAVTDAASEDALRKTLRATATTP